MKHVLRTDAKITSDNFEISNKYTLDSRTFSRFMSLLYSFIRDKTSLMLTADSESCAFGSCQNNGSITASCSA